jgi:LPXTG-site transpeptidase (sortase) family protein
MSLRINNLVRKITQIVLGLIILFLVGCLIKVTIWEHNYYSEKEGSQREPIIEIGLSTPDQEAEVDEADVTPEQVRIHTVAPDQPRYISATFIDRSMGLGAKARVFEVGLTKTGAMATRAGIFDVAWYRNSAKPGQGGTILVNGHNGGPTKVGVFKYLDQAQVGDIITIERGDGTIFNYEVRDKKTLLLSEANDYMPTMQSSPIYGKESLSLISCTGQWSQQQRTYLSRIMVRAVLVENIQ